MHHCVILCYNVLSLSRTSDTVHCKIYGVGDIDWQKQPRTDIQKFQALCILSVTLLYGVYYRSIVLQRIQILAQEIAGRI